MSAADEQPPPLHQATLRLLSLLAGSRSEKDLLQEGIETLAALSRARYGALGLVDVSRKLTQFVYTGITPEEAQRIGRLPEGHGLLGTAIHVDQVLRLDDVTQDPRAIGFPPNHPLMKSLLVAPISHQGVIIGHIYLSGKTDGQAFSDDDQRLLKYFAQVFALILARHRAQTERGQAAEQERRRSVDALQESEQNLRAIAENADEGILVNLDGKHVFVNQRLAAILGYQPGELLNTTMQNVVHPDEYPRIQKRFQSRMAGQAEPSQYETLFINKTGQGVPVEISAATTTWQGRPAGLIFVRDITARKQAETQMRQLSSAIEQTADAVAITNRDGVIEYVNPAFEEVTGFSRAEALGDNPRIVKSGEHDPAFYQLLWQTILKGQVFREVFINRRKNRELYYEQKTITPLKDEQRRVTHFVSTGKDITAHMRTEQALRENNEILERIFDSTHFCLAYLDRDFNFIRVNQAYAKACGYAPEYFPGKNHFQLYPHEENEAIFRHVVQTGKPFTIMAKPFEFPDHPEWGVTYWDWTLHPVKDSEANIEALLFVLLDVTERKRTEERLNHLAHYDTLTGLPNRLLLQDRLNQSMFEADRRDRVVAVMFLDLDRFKIINDTLGHETGDALLKEVAGRLAVCVRAGDTISRLGGDEFTVVLANVAHVDDVARVAQKIIDSFVPPFNIAGRELFISTSIGITLYPFDANDLDSLLRNADAAMYHAKEMGRNTFQFYTAELNRRTAKRLRLETALRHALERHELLLHYQPQVDLKTGKIIGAEALLRWQHPEMGLIPPLDFIALAEETGLIIPIGEWVLRAACHQAQAWHQAGFHRFQVAVNLSGRQLQYRSLAKLVKKVLQETGLDPRYLDLELTESLLMHNTGHTLAAMEELHAHGVAFSMDDFGTGYSSLSYLKRFPIDTLKIDQSFVRDIPADPDDAAIAQAIIAMAHSLEIKVIAEGVETARQLAFMRAHQCDGMQGYYFSKPVPAEKLTALLQKDRHPRRRAAKNKKRARRRKD